VIYAIDVYTVLPRDTSAFSAAFENGPWRRLSWQENGHLHTALHLRSTLPTTYLSLGIWKSEAHYLIAVADREFRDFLRSLKLLSTSSECIGAFHYQCQPLSQQIPSYPSRIPVSRSVHDRAHTTLPKAS